MPLNAAGEMALYQQLADRIRERVLRRELRAGDALPPVRELAQALNLNQNTVHRAYGILRSQGVLEGRRGQGTRIASGMTHDHVSTLRSTELTLLVERMFGEAAARGFEASEVRAALDRQPVAPARPAAERKLWIGLGSHDLCLELAFAHAQRLAPGHGFSFAPVGSMAGLMALSRGETHFATSHLLDVATGEYNARFVRELMPRRDVTLLALANRTQGFILKRGNPKKIAGFADLARSGVRFVNRQRGAGTRTLLDRGLQLAGVAAKQVRGYDNEALTHLEIVQQIAAGAADVGLGIEAAARAAGLSFIPIAQERFELVLPSDSELIAPLKQAVRDETFKRAVVAMGGYDASISGEIRKLKAKK